MIQRMLTSALVAGGVAGLFAALLHFAFIQDKILLAEQYEAGALVHFTGAAPAARSDDHSTAVPAPAPTAVAAEPGDPEPVEARRQPHTADREHRHGNRLALVDPRFATP